MMQKISSLAVKRHLMCKIKINIYCSVSANDAIQCAREEGPRWVKRLGKDFHEPI